MTHPDADILMAALNPQDVEINMLKNCLMQQHLKEDAENRNVLEKPILDIAKCPVKQDPDSSYPGSMSGGRDLSLLDEYVDLQGMLDMLASQPSADP